MYSQSHVKNIFASENNSNQKLRNRTEKKKTKTCRKFQNFTPTTETEKTLRKWYKDYDLVWAVICSITWANRKNLW